MARTSSTMLALGTLAPPFRLPDTQGRAVSLEDFSQAEALLVVFMCNHCPYVKHIRGALATLAREYQPRGLAMIGISANDAENYPDDSPEKMAEEVIAAGYSFLFLFVLVLRVVFVFCVVCTTEIYIIVFFCWFF